MKKVGFIIGRFQVPTLHRGHIHLIEQAMSKCDRLVFLLGSSNRARSVKNPWTYRERAARMMEQFPYTSQFPLNDYKYSDTQWQADVAATIKMCLSPGEKPVLFGHFKEGNDYLKWFPQFEFHNIESNWDIDGTRIREANPEFLPQCVQDDMKAFAKDREAFANYPYLDHLNINCADPILECAGHVLLIKRKLAPGAGTWGFPGGHKKTLETFVDCAIRELYEETNVRVPEKVLRGSIRSTTLYDSFTRGCGLPKTTVAVHMVIQPDHDGKLPRANASDDAAETAWVPIQVALNEYSLYDDHSDILSVETRTTPIIAFANPSIYTR